MDTPAHEPAASVPPQTACTNGQDQTSPASNGDPKPVSGDSPPATYPIDLAAVARFPRHKISRLPPDVRQSINRMLRQRIPYREIIPQLGQHGTSLNKNNLSRWKKTGYRLWLQEQEKREEAHAQLQLLLDLVRENDNGTIHEAAQQLATLKICYALAELDLTALKQTLQQDPAALLHLVQALPKLSQGGMACELKRLQAAKRKLKIEQDKIPMSQRGISDEALHIAEEKLRLL